MVLSAVTIETVMNINKKECLANFPKIKIREPNAHEEFSENGKGKKTFLD